MKFLQSRGAERRFHLWLKLPLKMEQEFVIGAFSLDGKRLELILVGYFEPEGSVRHVFSSSFVKKLRPPNRPPPAPSSHQPDRADPTR